MLLTASVILLIAGIVADVSVMWAIGTVGVVVGAIALAVSSFDEGTRATYW